MARLVCVGINRWAMGRHVTGQVGCDERVRKATSEGKHGPLDEKGERTVTRVSRPRGKETCDWRSLTWWRTFPKFFF